MSMGRTHDRPLPPRPLFESLPSAIRCAIQHGTQRSDIKPEKIETRGGVR